MQALIINQRNTLPIEELNLNVDVFRRQSRLAGIPLAPLGFPTKHAQVMPYWDTVVSVNEGEPTCMWYCFRRSVELNSEELLAFSEADQLIDHRFDDDSLTFLHMDLLSILRRASPHFGVESVTARGDWYYVRCWMTETSFKATVSALLGKPFSE